MPIASRSTGRTDTTLQEQIADAVSDERLPISKLLRLMWALDADQTSVNQQLREQLRARIGAPLNS